MKVNEIIEYLKRDYNPEDDLIVAYWDRHSFGMSEEEFGKVAEEVEHSVDWSRAHEDISYHIERIRQSNES
jgi:hypothetical protein